MSRKKNRPDTELGYRLTQIRLENNLSVSEVAERIGRDKATISRYEDGRTNPDAETIKAYSQAFDVDPNWLLGWGTNQKFSEEHFRELWEQHGIALWAELNR